MRKFILFAGLILALLLVIFCAGCITESVPADKTADKVNYADTANWLLFPETQTHDIDVIYLYPTVFSLNPTVTNAKITDYGMRAGAASVYKHQGSVFETVGDVFVPYYRQFTGETLSSIDRIYNEIDVNKVLSTAKNDVFDAIDYYFEHKNNGRPFILAGHSQGTMMLKYVLSEYMVQHPEYYKNMIAAYLVGISTDKSFLTENPHLKAAEGADDTGVIVSWNTELAGSPDAVGVFKKSDAIVINPLNWKTDSTYAGVEENHGSFVRFENGTYGIGPGLVDAKIENGAVIVSEDSDITAAKTLSPLDVQMIVNLAGPYSRHMDDYDYFYVNIRENAAIRAAAFLENKAGNA